MLSVSRPIEVVVLNACVTDTKVTIVPVEHLDQLGEVHQRARQAVDLVDDDHVDESRFDILDEAASGAGRSSVPPEKPPSS